MKAPAEGPGSHPGLPRAAPLANCRDGRARLTRRAVILGGSVAAAGVVGYPLARHLCRPRASVFVVSNQRYDGRLVHTIRDGLSATGLRSHDVRGKRVLIKPNLVEPSRQAPHVTSHPTMVQAVAEVFRFWGARVAVGEGPGHVRDTETALVESGLQEALRTSGLPFRDLNYEDVRWTVNKGRASDLNGLYLPKSVVEADLIVSLPKMKTHHWVGVTASMKNLYGVIPGIRYGWPKNVLHFNGIPETVFDINAILPKTIAVIDAITCMEGDGPIMGSPKEMGLVLVGTVPAAVDATACRLMGVDPTKVPYLALAANRLGPIDESLIDQRGERWQPLAERFEILDVPHLRRLRT